METAIEFVVLLVWLVIAVVIVISMARTNSGAKSKRSHSNEVKSKAIEDVEKGMSQKDAANKYEISTGLINDWIKKKDKIQKAIKSGNKGTSKIRASNFPKVEAAVVKWLRDVRDKNGTVNGVQLLARAAEFSTQFPDESGFKASTGWLRGFMSRNHVVHRTLKGEANSVNLEDVENFKNNTLKDVLNRYHVNNIFNCDEAGMMYGATSKKTLTFKGDNVFGTKEDKRRITLLFCASMS